MLVQLNKYIQRISDMNMSNMIGQSIMEHPPQDSNFNYVFKLLTETDDCQKLIKVHIIRHHTCSGTAFGSEYAPVDASYTLRWLRAREERVGDERVGRGKITGVDATGGATSSGVTSPNNVRSGVHVRDTRRCGVDDPNDWRT